MGPTAGGHDEGSGVGASPRADRTTVPAAAVVAVCASEILGLAGYSIIPALLPQFMAEWSLSSTAAGWLTGMVFAGYMVGVLPLVSLTDRVPARTVYIASSALNVVACFGFALTDGVAFGLVFP